MDNWKHYDSVQIEIPEGRYEPEFVFREESALHPPKYGERRAVCSLVAKKGAIQPKAERANKRAEVIELMKRGKTESWPRSRR